MFLYINGSFRRSSINTDIHLAECVFFDGNIDAIISFKHCFLFFKDGGQVMSSLLQNPQNCLVIVCSISSTLRYDILHPKIEALDFRFFPCLCMAEKVN